MSRRAWKWGIPLGLLGWAIIFGLIFGCRAAAAPLSETPSFLARYGLVVNEVPVVVVPASEMRSEKGEGQSIDGESHQDRILLNRQIVEVGGLYLARLALHEWLHQASMWRWPLDEFRTYWVDAGREWGAVYEEGLVEAKALDLLPNYWWWLTGKRLRWDLSPAYSGHVGTWRAWSARATGKPWRSREAVQWRTEALTWGPVKRMEAVRAVTEETA